MKRSISLCLIMSLTLILSGCYDRYPQEKLGIIVGLGYDLEDDGVMATYKDTSETFVFRGQQQIDHEVATGPGKSIYSTQDELQSKSSRKWIIGSELVYLIGEERAEYGIKDLIDAMMRDADRRRGASVAVSRQTAEQMFQLQPKAYSTMAEDIHGTLEFAWQESFFSKDIKISNVLQMYHQEGREMVIPYLGIDKNRVKVIGLALFDGDKMITTVGLAEAKLINLLRNNKTKGHLSVNFPERNNYYEGYFTSNRKVKVSKEEENLKYSIDVTLRGNLKVNTVINKAITKKEVKEIEKDFEKVLKKDLEGEIKKIQQSHGVDWLDLSKYAVAKYGRLSDYGSNENFKNAQIDVNVKVKIDSIGGKTE
ncbi:Ger(x)C family spore germination protein [Clostridium sp. BSD9I1]|uniref:Ger(x)C family spore germination protein n=1 Tax=Clostridium sp. BSD9I1 TaxID=2003589 RepID=UPI0016483E60|nr:Ger(x)C family spore germination protein [Clostridium sp. BSD9I1]